jgi:hypothetical protein
MIGASSRRTIAAVVIGAVATFAFLAALARPARAAGTLTLFGCPDRTNPVWHTDSNGGDFGHAENCAAINLASWPAGIALGGGSATNAQYASWYTAVPTGIEITGAAVKYFARDLGSGGWAGDWLMSGRLYPLANSTGGNTYESLGAVFPPPNGPPPLGEVQGPTATGTKFGWTIQCRAAKCSNNGDMIQVGDVLINAQETNGPTFGPPSGLWAQSGWVRGNWNVQASADGPSGVCTLLATLNGQAITPYANYTPSTPNQTVWHQCPSASMDVTIDTHSYGQGKVAMTLSDSDAASLGGTVWRNVYIDNSAPSISLSGPTNAATTAGTQYVTASASDTYSGIYAIVCSVDGGPTVSYKAATAAVPVSGVGAHLVRCYAEDNAVDDTNAHGVSGLPISWSLKIGAPTVSGISFGKLVGALRCTRVDERIRVPTRCVTVRRRHKLVRVRGRGHVKVVEVVKCHPRTAKQEVVVWVTVKRHGETVRIRRRKVERVVVAPHLLGRTTERVPFGRGVTVSGWLGGPNGTALGARPVVVMTAPENGRGDWTEAAVVTTAADGAWTLRLPRGPSRLVAAFYGGDATTEPSSSRIVHLVVPARVRVSVTPTQAVWGGTIQISGRVLGGYIPSGAKLLRLRIGVAGVRETVGIPNVARNGRFHTTWKFAPGRGVVRYWFSISTLKEDDYPFAPASSKRVYVTVG